MLDLIATYKNWLIVIAIVCVLGFSITGAATIWIFVKRLLMLEKMVKTQRIKAYLQTSKALIHYEQLGTGKTDLVLIHGIAASMYIWRFLTPLFEKDFRITMIDVPGFGYSSKDPEFAHTLEGQSEALIEFFDALKIKKPHLVGSSMGGAIALFLALKYPDHIGKVVGISPACNPKLTKKIKLQRIRKLGKQMRFFINEQLVAQLLRFVVSNKKLINSESRQTYMKPFLDDGSSILCFIDAFDHLLADERMPDIFREVQAEVLLLWGGRDPLTPSYYGEELVGILPRAKLVVNPEASHHLMEDDPDWTAKNVLEFLA